MWKIILIILWVLVLIVLWLYFFATYDPEERRMTDEERMNARIAYDKAMVAYKEWLKKWLRLNVKSPKCKRPKDFYEKLEAMKKEKK